MLRIDHVGRGWYSQPRAATQSLVNRLADERSKRVVFLSHCLLNENVRYLGGATRAGVVQEVLDRYTGEGIGIYQMPCPEQRVWGGVLKRRMARLYGMGLLLWPPACRSVVAMARWWTTLAYRRIARQVASDIQDYLGSDFEVVEIVGVGASPTCGVLTTLDLYQAVHNMARCDPFNVDRSTVNDIVVARSVIAGSGMFTNALRHQLARRGIEVEFTEHDLLGELRNAQAAASKRLS